MLAEIIGIPSVPKNHLCMHMLHRARFLGNPTLYSCWIDEGLNRALKLLLRGCHSRRFELMAFAKSVPVSKGTKRPLG